MNMTSLISADAERDSKVSFKLAFLRKNGKVSGITKLQKSAKKSHETAKNRIKTKFLAVCCLAC